MIHLAIQKDKSANTVKRPNIVKRFKRYQR